MNARDYQARLAVNVSAVAEGWGKEGTGHVLRGVIHANFLPAFDRRSPAPRGRIVSIKTGACRVALPGEIAEWCRLIAGPTLRHRSILWDALQRTPWNGGRAQ